jgi:putative ABC transport system permease protein
LVGARRSLLLKMLGSEVALVAASAIVAGLAIGAATPALVGHFATDLLPVAPDPRPQWLALLLSAGFGLLVTFAASWRALAGAIATRPLALLRGDVAEDGVARVPRWPAWAAIGGAVGLALIAADQPRFAATAIAAIGLLAGLFALLGVALRKGARRWSHRGGPLVRLGLAALDRPGAATGRLLVSLGVGLSLLVALAATASSLLASIASESEARAPALFLLDIPRDEQARFEAIAARTLPDASLRLVPSLRGPVIAVNGTRVVDLPAIPEGAWVLRGDRGLTFARDLPDHNRIVSGAWWPKDYAGPPLISLDADAAKALGLKVGDRMTIGVLGRPIEARIASLRQIDWRSLGFNFAIIFDPATLSAAPFTWMASVATPRDTAAFERAVGDALPMASTLRVAEIVSEIARLLAAIEGAVRVAAGFALAIGMVVLAGSVVATRATRQRDIVLLRLVGATSAQVIATQAIEFLAIATAAATGAAITGIGAAYGLTRWQFDLPFAPDWASVLALPLAAILLAAGAALAAAQAPLRARPAAGLRTT